MALVVTVLELLFVGLKLAGVISWSWLWVLSPIWIWVLAGHVFMGIFVAAEKKP